MLTRQVFIAPACVRQKYLHKNKGPGLCHICRTPLSGQLEPLHAAVTALMKSKSELGFNFNNIPKNPALKAGGLPGADCSLACWESSRSQAAPLGPETLVLPLSQPCRPKGCLSPSLLATAPLSSGGAGSQRRSGRIWKTTAKVLFLRTELRTNKPVLVLS